MTFFLFLPFLFRQNSAPAQFPQKKKKIRRVRIRVLLQKRCKAVRPRKLRPECMKKLFFLLRASPFQSKNIFSTEIPKINGPFFSFHPSGQIDFREQSQQHGNEDSGQCLRIRPKQQPRKKEPQQNDAGNLKQNQKPVPDAEILLCDTEHILYAENPISDRAKPGNRLGDMERSFIEEEIYKTRDSVSNYRALLPSRERLRASTLFLRNEDGSLAGFLTINIRVESMLQARDIIDTLINGSSPYSAGYIQKGQPDPQPELISRYEGVTIVVSDIIHTVVEEFLGDFGVLVKGAISEVAKQLGCSEATIYRYLQ